MTHDWRIDVAKARIEARAPELAVQLYPDLRKVGREYRAGKKGSFWLKSDGSQFYGHEAGEGGDAITLALKVEGGTFPELLERWVGARDASCSNPPRTLRDIQSLYGG